MGHSRIEGHDISCPYGCRHDGVLGLCVYTERNGTIGEGKRLADGNYWTTTGWEDHAISDFDQGERRREGWVVEKVETAEMSQGATVRRLGPIRSSVCETAWIVSARRR